MVSGKHNIRLKNKFITIDNHNNVNVPVKILNLRFNLSKSGYTHTYTRVWWFFKIAFLTVPGN